MIIKDINKKIHNTPDNINEELTPISEEYIRRLFEDLSGDDSTPLDYYTKVQVDAKIQELNTRINLNNSNISSVEDSINSSIAAIEGNVTTLENSMINLEGNVTNLERNVSSAGNKITTLENKVSTMKNITYSTVEPTNEQGENGDLWIIYEG